MDPAISDYIPTAGGDNSKLPAGGVFTNNNLSLYHYANNNPITYTDPDGRMAGSTQVYFGANFAKDMGKLFTNWFSSNKNDTQNTTPVIHGTPEQFVNNMLALVGTPYVWGGNSPADGGMDCSGSILYGLNQMGNEIPDMTANDIYNNYTVPIEDGDVRPGDVRFLLNSEGKAVHIQTITNSDGTRVNATGDDSNTIDNPGIFRLYEGAYSGGEVRRLNFEKKNDTFINNIKNFFNSIFGGNKDE